MTVVLNGIPIGDFANIQVRGEDAIWLYPPATQYDDLPPVPITSARLGASAPTLATFIGNIEQYTFDAVNDYVVGATEVTHKYREGSNLTAHIHWATNGSEGSEKAIKFQLEYSVSNGGVASPFSANFASSTLLSAEQAIPASTPDRAHLIVGLGTIPGASLKIGAYIVWRFSRLVASGTAPLADPFVLAVGIHNEMDTIGSRQLYIK